MKARVLGGAFSKAALCINDRDHFNDVNDEDMIQIPHENDSTKFWCFDVESFRRWYERNNTNPLTDLDWTPTQNAFIYGFYKAMNVDVPRKFIIANNSWFKFTLNL